MPPRVAPAEDPAGQQDIGGARPRLARRMLPPATTTAPHRRHRAGTAHHRRSGAAAQAEAGSGGGGLGVVALAVRDRVSPRRARLRARAARRCTGCAALAACLSDGRSNVVGCGGQMIEHRTEVRPHVARRQGKQCAHHSVHVVKAQGRPEEGRRGSRHGSRLRRAFS
eukprot:scaffold22219_cov133-Isochrysis_galbana.AAC.1